MPARHRKALAVIAAVAAALAACGSDEREDEPAPVTTADATTALPETVADAPAPKGPVPREVRGTYVMRSEKGDGLPFAGRWRLELQADEWSLIGPRRERNAGMVSGDGERLVIRDDCTDEPGIYGYELRGGVLELRADDLDPCSGREIKLTWSSNPWRRR